MINYAPKHRPKRRSGKDSLIPGSVSTPRPPNDTGVYVDSGTSADEGKKIDKRKFNGRKKGTKNLKTIAKEAIVTDEFYKLAQRKVGGLKDVYEVLFAKAVGEQDMQAIKIIMDKVMPNAQIEKEGAIKDLGIVINIGDMKAVSIDKIDAIEAQPIAEGEVIADS